MTDKDPIRQDKVLDPAQVRLYRTTRGLFSMHLDGVEHEDLRVRRAFPLERPDGYIGFLLPDNTELGMLVSVEELDAPSRQVLAEELEKTYFLPVITHIAELGEEFGVVHADVETTVGRRQIEIRGIRSNIRLLSRRRALIVDAIGNRYELPNTDQLPQRTKEILGF